MSSPITEYEQAIQKIEDLKLHERKSLNEACHLQILSHGKKMNRAIVFLHGYTNCPAQFIVLGKKLYELGFNVYIPNYPHHGLADRMNEEHALLTAEELISVTDHSIDIAQGLGDTVVVAGISAGGVLAAWAAQNRKDIQLAVTIAPSFGFKKVPTFATGAIAKLFSILPNKFEWWDAKRKADLNPDYAYPRFSTRALAEILQIGFYVKKLAGLVKPTCPLLIITNENDGDVNNKTTHDISKKWQKHGGTVHTFTFDKNLGLNHDLIDPHQPDQKTDIVYPQIISLVNGHFFK